MRERRREGEQRGGERGGGGRGRRGGGREERERGREGREEEGGEREDGGRREGGGRGEGRERERTFCWNLEYLSWSTNVKRRVSRAWRGRKHEYLFNVKEEKETNDEKEETKKQRTRKIRNSS